MLMKILATADIDFVGDILLQLANASVHKGEVNERELNFQAFRRERHTAKGPARNNPVCADGHCHSVAMNMASGLNGTLTLPQLEVQGRLLNNLTRTFAMQMETLKRCRSTGEQKVTVEHVTVKDGGNAMFGNVIQGGRGS